MQLHSQRGGTFLGFIIGLVLGLGVALAVAVYVTKVPTPFSNKSQTRNNDQDAQESQKNKDWNPNSVLQPKGPAQVTTSPKTPSDETSSKAASATGSIPAEAPKAEPRPAVTADPLGDLAKSKSSLSTPADSSPTVDPFDYIVQVGAYRSTADAEAQKAKLALLGLEAKVSERDQGGRMVFRVRLGPYPDKAAAERIRTKLESGGIENTLVRVQR